MRLPASTCRSASALLFLAKMYFLVHILSYLTLQNLHVFSFFVYLHTLFFIASAHPMMAFAFLIFNEVFDRYIFIK